MSNKLVWSSNMTQDYFMGLNPSEMRAELVDFGYEPEMLDRLDEQGLYDLIAADDSMWQMDSEEFEYNVRPMIEKQTRDGIVLMSGSVGRWTGNHSGGKAAYAEDLVGGDICQDCYEIAIYDVNGVLQWQGCHHDGCHYMNLYALPEEEIKIREFIEICCPGVIEEEAMMGEDGQTRDESLEIIVEDFMNGNYDPEWLNDWCDFSKVPEVCEPIRDELNMRESLYKDYNLVSESIEEDDEEDDDENYPDTSNFKIISAMDYGDDYYRDIRIIFEYNGQKYCYHDGTSASGWGDTGRQISKEFDLEDALHANGGYDFAWELSDNNIRDLISYAQKLEADKWHDTITIEESVEESCKEESCTKEKTLGEGKLGKAVNKDKVIIETEQLKNIFNNNDMDEIYSMYLFNPEEEDASFQYVYPNFFKHVLLPYLKEYDLIEVDKLKDPVYIDEITNYWSEGEIPDGNYLINNDDWKRMFHAVDLRVSNDKNIQWDKIPWEDDVSDDESFEEDLDPEDQPLPDRI